MTVITTSNWQRPLAKRIIRMIRIWKRKRRRKRRKRIRTRRKRMEKIMVMMKRRIRLRRKRKRRKRRKRRKLRCPIWCPLRTKDVSVNSLWILFLKFIKCVQMTTYKVLSKKVEKVPRNKQKMKKLN